MKELSVFIDESGDFGAYDFHAPYYIISMVFHDQDTDLTEELNKLDTALSYMDLDNLCIHAGPVIRQEEEYRFMEPEKRTTGSFRRCFMFYWTMLNLKK